MAVNLYVIVNIANLSLERISKAVIPFVAIMLVALLVTMVFPSLSIWLPSLFGLR